MPRTEQTEEIEQATAEQIAKAHSLIVEAIADEGSLAATIACVTIAIQLSGVEASQCRPMLLTVMAIIAPDATRHVATGTVQ